MATTIPTAEVGRVSEIKSGTLDDLRQHAREAVLIEPRPDEVDALKQAGFQIEERYPKPWEIVYIK